MKTMKKISRIEEKNCHSYVKNTVKWGKKDVSVELEGIFLP